MIKHSLSNKRVCSTHPALKYEQEILNVNCQEKESIPKMISQQRNRKILHIHASIWISSVYQ